MGFNGFYLVLLVFSSLARKLVAKKTDWWRDQWIKLKPCVCVCVCVCRKKVGVATGNTQTHRHTVRRSASSASFERPTASFW